MKEPHEIPLNDVFIFSRIIKIFEIWCLSFECPTGCEIFVYIGSCWCYLLLFVVSYDTDKLIADGEKIWGCGILCRSWLVECELLQEFIMMSGVVKRILNGFKPSDYGLAADFLLTKLTQMKGCGCKVPRTVKFIISNINSLFSWINFFGNLKDDVIWRYENIRAMFYLFTGTFNDHFDKFIHCWFNWRNICNSIEVSLCFIKGKQILKFSFFFNYETPREKKTFPNNNLCFCAKFHKYFQHSDSSEASRRSAEGKYLWRRGNRYFRFYSFKCSHILYVY